MQPNFDNNAIPRIQPVPAAQIRPAIKSSQKKAIPERPFETQKKASPHASHSSSEENAGTKVSPREVKQSTSTLSQDQQEILYGILLGDANLQTENGGRTYRLRVSQSEEHKAYVFHLYEIFKPLILTKPSFNEANKTWYWNTRQDPCFRFYAQQFYAKTANGTLVKKVPRNIHRWLSLKTVAYWYMDDGSVKDRGKSPAMRFCTDSFSKEDVLRLIEALQDRYSVPATIFENRTNQYRIYIGAGRNHPGSKKGVPLTVRDSEFGKQFLPYIIPEMRMKVPPLWLPNPEI